MFDPARFMDAFARHGLLESALSHAAGGDVPIKVGVQESSADPFSVGFSSRVLQIEWDRQAVELDAGSELTLRGVRWRIAQAPQIHGAHASAALQQVSP